jgi:hypothetical protein
VIGGAASAEHLAEIAGRRVVHPSYTKNFKMATGRLGAQRRQRKARMREVAARFAQRNRLVVREALRRLFMCHARILPSRRGPVKNPTKPEQKVSARAGRLFGQYPRPCWRRKPGQKSARFFARVMGCGAARCLFVA